MKNALQQKAVMKKIAKAKNISVELVLQKLYAGALLGARVGF